MNNQAFKKIAEGHKLISEGYLELASTSIQQAPASTAIENEGIEAQQKSEEPKLDSKKVTIEDVRAILAEKTRDGKTQKVKTLLTEFGADKLSSVPEEKLADLKAKAEVL